MAAGVLAACAGAAGLSCAWFAAEVAAEFDVAGFDCANIAATAKASAAAINTARIQVTGLTCLSSDEPADLLVFTVGPLTSRLARRCFTPRRFNPNKPCQSIRISVPPS